MTREWNGRKALVGAAVFAIAFLYVYWIAGDVLRTAGDEGIYLEGGRRVALGQQPYRDFLCVTGPLTFWTEGVVGHWTGLSLAWMRLPMVLDAAFLAWAVYWFTSRWANVFYSAGTSLAYLAFQSHIRKLVVNHRWDSAALATASIAAALAAERTGRRGFWLVPGFLVAAAACATPSMWVVAVPLLCWCWRRGAGAVLEFLGGGALVAGATGIYLQWHGCLAPMIQALRWTAANYTGPNRLFYGHVSMASGDPGGAGVGYWVSFVYAAIPAILPVAAVVGWGWRLWRKPDRGEAAEMLPLLAAAAALVFSAWPRWSADTLLDTVALSWCLCALLLYRVTVAEQRRWLCGVILLASLLSLGSKSIAALEYLPRETRVGTVRAPADEGEFLAALERWVQPGDSLFSFPYEPALYYWLNAHNPTYYSFLQPGMMTVQDELRAVGELEAAPPRWVIFEKWPPAAVLAIWPGSDPALIPMATMNAYLSQHYRPVDNVTGPWGHMVVMERAAAPIPEAR
jgi:hypothetical protein